jgi:hypothetical protein
VGKSHELIEFIRNYEPGTFRKQSADKFMRSLRIDAFDDDWTPTLNQAKRVRQMIAEQPASASLEGEVPQLAAAVLVTETATLTSEQAVVMRFIHEWRGDPHPYVLGMLTKAKEPGWVPTDENVEWVRRRVPEWFGEALVDLVGVEEVIAHELVAA